MYSRSTYSGEFPMPEYLRSRYKAPEHYDGVAFGSEKKSHGVSDTSYTNGIGASEGKNSMPAGFAPVSFSGTAEENFSGARKNEKTREGVSDTNKSESTEKCKDCTENDVNDIAEKDTADDAKQNSAPVFSLSHFDGDDILLASIILLIMSGEEKGENDDLILLLIFLMFLH